MKYLGANEIRESFLSFWESKGCLRHESFSLVPHNDKSLLLINAGMAPLKPFFTGAEEPPRRRLVTCQKCIRTGDIDNVGRTDRHATFFEMLGNFSFGDYFKLESIQWGWEFITGAEWLDMPKEKIWATVYQDDDEAYNIWKDVIGMPEEHIVRLGKKDNFWEIGTGPCGPCSELYFDRGPEYGCGKPDCKPGCDCDRYMEFWNHVFTQFDHHEDGSYTTLSQKNIDTGMGLERMACILQGVDSIYNVDTMQEILQEVCRISGSEYKDGEGEHDTSVRIITDHIRSVVFLISDGVLPSNEGRGYVLRRLLRRAARHGRLIGMKGAFLYELADKVFATCGGAYPELLTRRDYIKKVIYVEEKKFFKTISQGMEIIDSYISSQLKKMDGSVLSGQQAFKLYDTYGFPFELTEEIAGEAKLSVDRDGFEKCMEEQKTAARAARDSIDSDGYKPDENAKYNKFSATEFTGYEKLSGEGKIIGLFCGSKAVQSAGEGEEVQMVLDSTPFYGEGGGQVGDKGRITGDAFEAEVTNTLKVNGVYVHRVKITRGEADLGDAVKTEVNAARRHSIARNHTATHLLQKALQMVLGNHVAQAGSYVDDKILRFDFTHFEEVKEDKLKEVEDIVNEEIMSFADVKWTVMPINDAKKMGAMALFGEKYGSEVRVVSVPGFSMELCGGTHAANVGQIGAFKIVSETGVAAGVRRIEALTGTNIKALLDEKEKLIEDVSKIFKTRPETLAKKAESIDEELKTVKKELERLKAESRNADLADIVKKAKAVNGIKLITGIFKDSSIDDLRSMSDRIKESEKNAVMVFAAESGEKTILMVSVSDALTAKGIHAGKMIKQIAAVCGGGGGGKADMAQAGAKDRSKLPEAFALAEKLLAD